MECALGRDLENRAASIVILGPVRIHSVKIPVSPHQQTLGNQPSLISILTGKGMQGSQLACWSKLIHSPISIGPAQRRDAIKIPIRLHYRPIRSSFLISASKTNQRRNHSRSSDLVNRSAMVHQILRSRSVKISVHPQSQLRIRSAAIRAVILAKIMNDAQLARWRNFKNHAATGKRIVRASQPAALRSPVKIPIHPLRQGPNQIAGSSRGRNGAEAGKNGECLRRCRQSA